MAALSAPSLAQHIHTALPSTTPQLKTPTDALAILTHAGLVAIGFRLIGLGEAHRLPSPSTTTTTLPEQWNALPTIDLKYTHPQSSMHFLVHVTRLATKVSIQALALGHDKVVAFDVAFADYLSPSALPASPTVDAESEEEARQKVTAVFISPARLADFGNLLKVNIVQKLVPSLQKEGYEDTTATSTSTSTSQQPQPPHPRDPVHDPPRHDPLRGDPPPAMPNPLADPSVAPRPQRPVPAGDFPPPGFEDEYDIHRPPRGMGSEGIGGVAPGYGERDLYPPGMGLNDPLRMGGRGGGGGGGMYMDMRDIERGGRPDFNPQVPPGARYDPVGPGGPGGGVPFDPLSGDGGGPRRGGGGGGFGGMGGRPPNPFSRFGDGDFI